MEERKKKDIKKEEEKREKEKKSIRNTTTSHAVVCINIGKSMVRHDVVAVPPRDRPIVYRTLPPTLRRRRTPTNTVAPLSACSFCSGPSNRLDRWRRTILKRLNARNTYDTRVYIYIHAVFQSIERSQHRE